MDDALIEELYDARRRGRTGLNYSNRHLSRETGFDLQLAVLDRFVQRGDRLAGWKIAYTSGNARDKMGPGVRPFGYILGSRSFDSGASVRFADFGNCAVEPELCVVLGATLEGDVTPEQARAAVRGIAPALELNEVRYAVGPQRPDGSYPALADDATVIADGVGQWGLVTGTEVSPDRFTSAASVELWQGDRLLSTAQPGPALDDPFLSLSRVCATLHRHGRRLEAGQRVITGSFSRAVVTGPSTWRADFKGIGEVTVRYV